ncbi:hypothetical protein NKH77_54300 [Streptomyces sp. M19]
MPYDVHAEPEAATGTGVRGGTQPGQHQVGVLGAQHTVDQPPQPGLCLHDGGQRRHGGRDRVAPDSRTTAATGTAARCAITAQPARRAAVADSGWTGNGPRRPFELHRLDGLDQRPYGRRAVRCPGDGDDGVLQDGVHRRPPHFRQLREPPFHGGGQSGAVRAAQPAHGDMDPLAAEPDARRVRPAPPATVGTAIARSRPIPALHIARPALLRSPEPEARPGGR